MIPYCNAHGIGLIPWGPLSGGELARPWNVSTQRKVEVQAGPYARAYKEQDEVIVQRVEEVAKKHGWTMGQVALAWIGTKVSSPIVGVSSGSYVSFCSLF